MAALRAAEEDGIATFRMIRVGSAVNIVSGLSRKIIQTMQHTTQEDNPGKLSAGGRSVALG
jgi:hypothetical protein